MSGAQIAAEIDAALAQVASEVGAGAFKVTLVEPIDTKLDPWSSGEQTKITYEVNALISDYSQNMIDGTLIERGDKKFIIAGNAPNIQDHWQIVSNGETYNIINIMRLAPSGVTITYEVQARR